MGKINRSLMLVFLISLLPLFNLLTQGLPITHDGMDHLARIASFYKNLSEGVLVPRWAGNLNWGYGHPILMFLYPLPSYIASFFHLLGFSIVNSFKLVLVTSFILSGISMYLWLREFLNEKASTVGAILYLFAPYRFIDLYVRGAVGEHVAFVFIPLVLLAILRLNKKNKKSKIKNYYFNFLFITLSFTALILSHNAISLIFTPFIIFYVLYIFILNKSKIKLIASLVSIVFGLLFSFFFWFPAFIEGRYTLRDIVTAGAYSERFINPKDLLYGSWNFGGTGSFSVQIGIIHIILLSFSIILFKKMFKKGNMEKYLFIGANFFLFASIFLMLKESNFVYNSITILQKLQFPWRFLSMTVFYTSLIGALFIDRSKLRNTLVACVILLTIIPTFSYWHAKEYKEIPDSFFEKNYNGTTDTGESSPIWSIRFMEKAAKNQIEVIDGQAKIVKFPATSTQHEYVISSDKRARIRENTLYFPGWKVYDNNKLIENIEFQDEKNRGVITFYVDHGLHNIIVKFENTKLRRTANLVSLFSIIIAAVFLPLSLIINKYKINRLHD